MSLLTTLVKPQAAPTTTSIARSSMTVCARSLHGNGQERSSQKRRRFNSASIAGSNGTRLANPQLEDIFVRSLVAAGSCRRHRSLDSSTFRDRRRLHSSARDASVPGASRQTRGFYRQTPQQQEALATAVDMASQISIADYGDLANTYPGFGQPRPERKTRHNLPSTPYYPLAPRLVLTAGQELHPKHGSRIILHPEDAEHRRAIKQLKSLLNRKLGHVPQHKLWEAWQNLRAPRPRYVDDNTLERLFSHLTWVEHKHSPESMHHFMSVLDECTSEQLVLKDRIWNTAIAFAGRWVRRVTSQEVKSAVEMWMRMENAGTRADTVTFNILFEVAVKAGRYALADMIFSELKHRNLTLDRYSRAGLIHYAGIKRDGDAVRHAFQEFVNAEEIVDTAVMNIVISALLRAGEPPAAENVFQKMKALHEKKFGTVGPSSWQQRKELGALLTKIGRQLRRDRAAHEASFFGAAFSTTERKEEIQRLSPIAPDATTYRLLIRYHCWNSGDLQRVLELLAEMKELGLHVHGSVYYHILRGFRVNSRSGFFKWNLKSLENIWTQLLNELDGPVLEPVRGGAAEPSDTKPLDSSHTTVETSSSEPVRTLAVDEEDDENVQAETERKPYFTAAIASAAVQAFYHCAGRRRMHEAWNEIQARWEDINEDERAHVQHAMDVCSRNQTLYHL